MVPTASLRLVCFDRVMLGNIKMNESEEDPENVKNCQGENVLIVLHAESQDHSSHVAAFKL
jgi:hypothetical protein